MYSQYVESYMHLPTLSPGAMTVYMDRDKKSAYVPHGTHVEMTSVEDLVQAQ